MIQWLGITLLDIGHARAVLTAWKSAPGNPNPLPSYGKQFLSPTWTTDDGVVLHAFAHWWNTSGYTPQVAEGVVVGGLTQAELTDAHVAVLDKWAAGAVPLPPVVDVPASKALLVLWGKTDGTGLVPSDYGMQAGDLPVAPWTKRDGQALMAFGKWSKPPISGPTFTTEHSIALKAWFAGKAAKVPTGFQPPSQVTPPAQKTPQPAQVLPAPTPEPGAKPPAAPAPVKKDSTALYVLGGLLVAVVGGLWFWAARTPRAALPPGPQENPKRRAKAKVVEARRPFTPPGRDSFVLQKFTNGSYRAALYDDALKWSAFAENIEMASFAWSRMPSESGATAAEAVQKLESRAGRRLEPWSYREIDALKRT